jgi:hypothetical protein
MSASAPRFLAHDRNHDDRWLRATLVAMKTSLRRGGRHALLAATLIGLLGCGHTSTSSAPTEPVPTGTAPPAAIAPTTPTPAAKSGATAITSVDVFYNAMTTVMDTPNNQKHLAEEAVNTSDLVAQLKGMGLTVNVLYDRAAGDDVVVKAPDGTELGRAALNEIERKNTPGTMIDKITAAIAARK